jgi:transposase
MAEQKLFVGIDVSKKWLDIEIHPTGQRQRVSNDAGCIRDLSLQLKNDPIERVIIEATGGYENKLVEEFCAQGLPVSVVNPFRVRKFAEGMNWFAKTDKIDAKVLANFGEKANPRLTVLPGEVEKRLAGLLNRRKQVLEMIAAERSRLENIDVNIRPYIESIIETLETQLAELDKEINQLTSSTPDVKKKNTLLLTVPGVGRITSAVLIARLPELGVCNRKQIAALVGTAPYNQDSGTKKGKRRTKGGREDIRCVLYMAILSATRFNPIIKSYYDKLIKAGKLTKVAQVACMRKLLVILNTMMRTQTAWNPNTSS